MIGPQFPPPHPVQFRGSRVAQVLVRWLGWKIEFDGLPGPRGVIVVYPHTSNWDFPVAILLKWAMGIQVQFWGKDTLFSIPLFGTWLRWLGGVPVNRTAAQGVVEQMVSLFEQKKNDGAYFWLALSPEGTRSYRDAWRSGFYRVALGAGVPLGVASLDYSRKQLTCGNFMMLTGDQDADMARIAANLQGCVGYRADLASPVRLDRERV